MNSDFVSQALGLPVPSSSHKFVSVTTDSRKIQPGCLFVALKGEKFDGHDFISSAIQAGATGILHQNGASLPAQAGSVAFFPVADTLEAYRKLGAEWRRKFQIPLIGIAGAHGKTTTKEILTAILRGRWPEVLKTEGSQNGFVGIPMTLLELRPAHGAAVIEIGIDEIGAMEKHLKIVQPTASLVTAIGPEHLERLVDVATVAREESLALSEVAAAGGCIAIALDDPWLEPLAGKIPKGQKIAYSLEGRHAAGVETLNGELSADLRSLRLTGMGLDGLDLPLPLLGRHNAANLLAAAAMARAQGLSRDEITQGLKTFQGAYGRSEIRELPAGRNPVLCDYYNANPASVSAGLELLTQISGGKPRWACLADMLELGTEEEQFHRSLAPKLLDLGIEHVLLYGNRMKWLEAELKSKKYKGYLKHFTTHSELAHALRNGIKPRDAVMIKGSRSMRMEEVWKSLSQSA